MGERKHAASVAATVAATDTPTMPRVEIVGERRRAHDAGFRAGVVTESLVPGTRIQELARRHGICASLIYRWRRLAAPQVGAASAVRLVPVRGIETRAPTTHAGPARPVGGAGREGMIEIELSNGVRVRVGGEVSVAALRRVMMVLGG